MKKEVISIRQSISPLQAGSLKERLKDNGFVEEVRIRFYPGVERTLKVTPYILHKENRKEDLFTFMSTTEGNISGDDDYFVFPCSIEFAYDDELCVDYNNTGTYPYSLVVDIIVSYMGV